MSMTLHMIPYISRLLSTFTKMQVLALNTSIYNAYTLNAQADINYLVYSSNYLYGIKFNLC